MGPGTTPGPKGESFAATEAGQEADVWNHEVMTIKTAVALVGAIVIILGLLAGAAVATGVESHKEAYAEWHKNGRFYRVHVWHFESVDGESSTTVRIAKGTCRRLSGGGTLCEPTRENTVDIPDRSFRLDEDDATATLDVYVFGRRTRVRWDGEASDPYPVLEAAACPNSDIGGMGIGWARDVTASGRVFGRRVNPSTDAILIQTTYANPC